MSALPPSDERLTFGTRLSRTARDLASGVAGQSDQWFLTTIDRIERAYKATGAGIGAVGRGAFRGIARSFGAGDEGSTTQQRVVALLASEVDRVNPELKGEEFDRFAHGIGLLVDHVVSGTIAVEDIGIVQTDGDESGEPKADAEPLQSSPAAPTQDEAPTS